MDLPIDIASDVLLVHPGIALSCTLNPVKVRKDHDLTGLIKELSAKINMSKEGLRNQPTIRALRDFYWRIGVDPTKVRPASEALARRFLSSRSLPRINNVVDAGNIASIETLVPIGIYDADSISGRVMLRFAKSGEEFVDISNDRHELDGSEIVLSDSIGILHLFPHRDSLRTAVTDQTSKVLIVGCGVPGMDAALVRTAVGRAVEIMKILGACS